MKGDYYRYVEQVVAMAVPQIMEEIMEVIRLVSQERIRESIVEETIDVPVSRVMEETVEVVKVKSQCVTFLADKKQAYKLNGGYAAQAPERKELRGLRDEELVTIRDINKLLDDELILKWSNFVKDVVDSEDINRNIYREILQQNKTFRVNKMNLAKKYLEMLAEIAELLRFNTSKSRDEQISFKEYVDRMKEGQHDICHITDESVAVVSRRRSEKICTRGVMRYSACLTLWMSLRCNSRRRLTERR